LSAFKLCGFDVGLDHRFFLIAGPCVIESEQSALDIAGELKEITADWVFHLSISLLLIKPIAPLELLSVAWAWKRVWRF
jgi:hypothetical protein